MGYVGGNLHFFVVFCNSESFMAVTRKRGYDFSPTCPASSDTHRKSFLLVLSVLIVTVS